MSEASLAITPPPCIFFVYLAFLKSTAFSAQLLWIYFCRLKWQNSIRKIKHIILKYNQCNARKSLTLWPIMSNKIFQQEPKFKKYDKYILQEKNDILENTKLPIRIQILPNNIKGAYHLFTFVVSYIWWGGGLS